MDAEQKRELALLDFELERLRRAAEIEEAKEQISRERKETSQRREHESGQQ